ncbi:MAG TPA: hypothetical protein VFH54_17490 [Mycobacteriales bacterium]|nr:hypothetical protein [Mycobacteriales bacterium]
MAFDVLELLTHLREGLGERETERCAEVAELPEQSAGLLRGPAELRLGFLADLSSADAEPVERGEGFGDVAGYLDLCAAADSHRSHLPVDHVGDGDLDGIA